MIIYMDEIAQIATACIEVAIVFMFFLALATHIIKERKNKWN